MRRRTVLATVGAAGVGSLAGCSELLEDLEQSSSPVPDVKELLQGEPQMIGADSPADHEYNVTIQNTGDAGDIGVALFWKTQTTTSEPSGLDSWPESGWERELLEEFYFESGERRTVEFRRVPPNGMIEYFFGVKNVSYGARIHNSGAGGEVTATLLYDGPQLLPETPRSTEKPLFIGENDTEEVHFTEIIPEGVRWEIEVEPA